MKRVRDNGAVRIAGLFGIAVVCQILFSALLPTAFYEGSSTDFWVRDLPMATQMLSPQGLHLQANIPAIGYPLLLSGLLQVSTYTGISFLSLLRLFALLCLGLTTVLVFFNAHFIWQSNAALAAGLLWCTYPFQLWLSGQNSTELPFLVFFLGALWFVSLAFAAKRQIFSMAVAGLLLGCAILIRPGALALPIVFAGVWFMSQTALPLAKRATAALALLVVCILVLTPWEWFIWHKTGRLVLVSTNDVASIRDGLTFGVVFKTYRTPIALSPSVKAFMQEAAAHMRELTEISEIGSFLLNQVQIRPAAVAEWVALKSVRVWYGTDSQRFDLYVLLCQIFYVGAGVIGFLSSWKYRTLARPFIVLLFSTILYFWFVGITVLPILRYMIPAMAILILFIPGIKYSINAKH